MSSLDRSFALLAAHQAGVASTAQARRLGFTRSAIAHRSASGRWERVVPGIVHLPGAPWDFESRLMVGLLLIGSRAVVSHRTAATVHGLLADRGEVVEFTGVRGDRVSSAVRLHSSIVLPPIDLVTIRRPVPARVRRAAAMRTAGLVTQYRATSAARTLIDLAAVLGTEDLGRALDEACATARTTVAHVRRRLADLRGSGRAGVTRLDAVLDDAGGHSVLERRYLRLMRESGLPRPRCQVVRTSGGTFLGRVDFDYRPIALVVEVGGRRGHSSDADRARDARRRNRLQALGLTVLEFTRAEVFDRPDEVVREVRRHLARLGHRG